MPVNLILENTRSHMFLEPIRTSTATPWSKNYCKTATGPTRNIPNGRKVIQSSFSAKITTTL